MNRAEAVLIAQGYLEAMRPFCERLEIGGSIRRNKAEVKDIEIICQPRVEHVQADLFGLTTFPVVPLYSCLHDLVKSGDLIKVKGRERYFQFQTPQGIALDLFCVLPPAQWGVIFTLRTGPAEFSHWLVTPRKQGGALPSNASVREGAVHVNARLIPMSEEADLFRFLGLGIIEPSDRVAHWRRSPVRNLPQDTLVISDNKA